MLDEITTDSETSQDCNELSDVASTDQTPEPLIYKPITEYSTREIGIEGEDIATAFLERRGYEILEHNWKSSVGEADIVALAPLMTSDEVAATSINTNDQHTEMLAVTPWDADKAAAKHDEATSQEAIQPPREVVLVEVKTRLALHEPEDSMPEIAVGKRKQQRYRKIALMYLALHSEYDSVRFDVVAINIVGESLARLRHLIGAYSWED